MPYEDKEPQVTDAPREAILYAATAVRSAFRRIPSHIRPCSYLGKYADQSRWFEDSDSCNVQLRFQAVSDFLQKAASSTEVLIADGMILCHGGTWDEAELVLSLADGSKWSVHHCVVGGESIVEVTRRTGTEKSQ